MIRSMTGFGKATGETRKKKITIELRSLNSKQLDINTRMPWLYKEKEIDIRAEISKNLIRGKIDLNVFVDVVDDQSLPVINKSAVKNYFTQLNETAGELNINSPEQLLSIIMRLPETLRTEKQSISDEEWKLISDILKDAIKELNDYREEEGKALESDLRLRIDNIEKYLKTIEPFEEERINSVRERINNNLTQLGSENIDMNRFEQEIIYYLEKLDLNEEKVRLRKHCDYFLETLNSDESSGKKLGFITQEIGREVNTIGSKANNASIQRIVVKMKDELEKVKEQVLNIL